MSYLIANSNGNLTAASWANVSAAALLDSEVGNTALTTGNLDSSTFVLEANQIDGFAVKLASRGASPTGTVTLTLRNSTTATNIWSITINNSDFDAASTTDDEGGWYFINGGSLHTPNGTDAYLIRLTVSSTTNPINFYRDGTANNWSRLVRRTNAVSPVAGDIMLILGEYTAAATKTNRTIAQDSTAATVYGAGTIGTAGIQRPGLGIGKGGLLSHVISGGTNLVFRLSGSLTIWSSGAMSIGTVGTEVGRTQTAVVEFQCTADDDFGLVVKNNATLNAIGLSRSSGKNVVWTLMTADAAAAATTISVADDTGWLNGDVVVLGTTTQTVAESEQLTLGADAGASSFPTIGALGFAHKGTTATRTQAEVILLTRNIKIRATNSSFGFRFDVGKTATVNLNWVEIQYGSNSGGGSSILLRTTSGTFTCLFCSFRDMRGGCIIQNQNTQIVGSVIDVEHCVMYNAAGNNFIQQANLGGTGGTYTLNDLVLIKNASGNVAITLNDPFGSSVSFYPTITSIRVVGNSGGAISFTAARDWVGAPAQGPFVCHGNAGDGLLLSASQQNLLIAAGTTMWRNSIAGINFSAAFMHNIEFTDLMCYGCASAGVRTTSSCQMLTLRIRDYKAYGDTTQAQSFGLNLSGATGYAEVRIDKGDFGTASGVWVTHSSADINVAGNRQLIRCVINNTKLSSATPFIFTYAGLVAYGSYLAFQKFQQTATSHKCVLLEGSLFYETGTVDVSPSLKMTPAHATRKLKSNAGVFGRGFLVPVLNGSSPVVSLKVQKDASYSGNAARMVLLGNPALGQVGDSVLATHSAGSGSFQTLSATLPVATDDGVWEVIIDCDGTAGNIFVDTGSVV